MLASLLLSGVRLFLTMLEKLCAGITIPHLSFRWWVCLMM